MPGKFHVVDEAAAAGQQRRVFEPRHARAEMFCAHGVSLRCAVAQALRRIERRFDDAGIAGAAAQIAGQCVPHVLLARATDFRATTR